MNGPNIVGKQFNRWSVLKYTDTTNGAAMWECKCDCGNVKIVRGTTLRANKSKSCGCLRNEFATKIGYGRRINLVKQRFGRLVVLEDVGNDIRGLALWKVKCSCGNIKVVSGASLRRGDTKSCGCYSRDMTSSRCLKDLSGRKFGRLTTIKRVSEVGDGGVRWLCKCDCGNETIVAAYNLSTGHTKSCGCYQQEMRLGENNSNWKDGITPKNKMIRQSLPYAKWRTKVFERDGYICQICDKEGLYIQAHHIYPFAKYINLRFEIWNGVTLCNDCHNRTKGKEHIFVSKFLNMTIDCEVVGDEQWE